MPSSRWCGRPPGLHDATWPDRVAGLGAEDHLVKPFEGCGLYGMLIGRLGLALGALRRHAAAVTVLVAPLYVLPGIASALPTSVARPVLKFWPIQAGQQIANVVPAFHEPSPWAGFAIMCAFVAIVLAAAHLSTRSSGSPRHRPEHGPASGLTAVLRSCADTAGGQIS